MNKNIAVLRGDGIGPEIVNEAIKVLDTVAAKYGHKFTYNDADIGGCSIDKHGIPLTEDAIKTCKASDSVLLGAVGGPKWDVIDPAKRPEKALLAIRKELGLFANLRPTKLFSPLASASPMGETVLEGGIDLLIVRELTGGIYFGEHKTFQKDGKAVASDIMLYDEDEIRRIGRVAFESAMKRRKKVTSVDKANVLDTSKLWRKIMHELSQEYPEVEYSDMLVDNTAMQLVRNPAQFDVIVTENMFGDILSDEASMLTGSIGMMPSASLSDTTLGMYEPIHGSAPDIAGLNVANPIGTIMSAAMMLRYSFSMAEEADCIENAVMSVLLDGLRTGDIKGNSEKSISCSQMGDEICKRI